MEHILLVRVIRTSRQCSNPPRCWIEFWLLNCLNTGWTQSRHCPRQSCPNHRSVKYWAIAEKIESLAHNENIHNTSWAQDRYKWLKRQPAKWCSMLWKNTCDADNDLLHLLESAGNCSVRDIIQSLRQRSYSIATYVLVYSSWNCNAGVGEMWKHTKRSLDSQHCGLMDIILADKQRSRTGQILASLVWTTEY